MQKNALQIGKSWVRANRIKAKVQNRLSRKKSKAILCQTNQLLSKIPGRSTIYSETTKTRTLKQTHQTPTSHKTILPPTTQTTFNLSPSFQTCPTLIKFPNHNLIHNRNLIIKDGSHEFGLKGKIIRKTNDKVGFLTK